MLGSLPTSAMVAPQCLQFGHGILLETGVINEKSDWAMSKQQGKP